MSYPFQGAPGSHPYPPSMSYPSAPPGPGAPAYPPYPQTNPGYPPGQNPYPNQSPYPTNTSPYPPQPSNPSPYYQNPAPYPNQPSYPSASPYPSSASSTPYPLNPSQSYPSHGGAGAPYPAQSSPYPAQSSPYPTQSSPYPAQSSPYPAQSSPYPVQSSPYPASGHGGGGGYGGSHSQTSYPVGSAPSHQHPHGGHHHVQTNPSVRPANPFNPRGDAEVLRKAMKGIGTDEAAIIAVLSKRTNAQRQEIAREFKTLYGKDLVKDLKSETTGKFEQLLVAMMTPIHEYYASEVHHAISGIGTKESTLIEVLCSLTNSELHYVKQAYERQYGTAMESDLSSDASGSFKRLLVSLCMGRRDENPHVDPAQAEADAQALLRAGELRFGTDESTFNAILSSRSFAQLGAIFSAYERLTGHPFEKAIKNEFSGDIEDGLLAIVKCVKNKPGFLAECLQKSMAGAGTNDRALIRLMVTRSENDLGDIQHQFQAIYGKSLESYIKGDASGDYKKMLIALLG